MNVTRPRPLHRVSLDPGHWRHVRKLLLAEAIILALVGAGGLVANASGGSPHLGTDSRFVELTPALCIVLLVVAVAAAGATRRRRMAGWFAAVAAVGGLAMVIISAVAAAHSAPGPLGFTDAAVLAYAAAFVFHFALGVWLVPDRIEGPEWVADRPDRRGLT